MTNAETQAALTRFYEAFARRDGETMAALYAPEATFEDPVFALEGADIGKMWVGLLRSAKDFSVQFTVAKAGAGTGVVEWTARYLFGGKKPVVNVIVSEIEMKDGLIVRQKDAFDFPRWAAQASGCRDSFSGVPNGCGGPSRRAGPPDSACPRSPERGVSGTAAPLSPIQGRLFIVAAALLWSTGGLAIKLVPLPALGVAFWRSLVSAIFLVAVFRPSRARWRHASFSTTLIYALMILTFVSATKMTTAANAIFLQYTGPLYVLAFAPFLLKERFRRVDAVAMAVALGGMSLFFVGRLDPGAFEGNLVAVVAGFFFGLLILFLRRDAAGDAIPSVIAGNFLAAAIALPFAFSHLALDARGILLVLFLGIVQLGFSYMLFVRGLAVVPAAEASLLGMLEPMFNPLWAFLGLGERPSAWALLGGGIVLSAVAGRTVFAWRAGDRANLPSPD